MTITLRRADERGHTRIGWLDSWHTFSFGDYYDPSNQRFSDLRVINDDRVEGGQGFDMHPHRDMEIVTIMLSGALRHQDSMGNTSVITPGEVQRMSAGTGVTHSEHNASPDEAAHLLQIWIFPEKQGIEPGYEQKRFSDAEKLGQLRLVASQDGREGSVVIHQDASLYLSRLEPGESVTYQPPEGRKTWLHVATGSLTLNDQPLTAGDGVGFKDNEPLTFAGTAPGTEFLLFDLR